MSTIKSAMVDITYYIESKQRHREYLTAKGKDTACVTAEIATMEAIRDRVDYLEQQNDLLSERAIKAERIAADSRHFARTAIAVKEARVWAIANKKSGFAKLLTMIEENPDYFDINLKLSHRAYDEQHFFMLKVMEKSCNPYKAKDLQLYRSYCEFANLPAEKHIEEWRLAFDRKQERMDLDAWLEEQAKNEDFLRKLYELIPGLKNVQR